MYCQVFQIFYFPLLLQYAGPMFGKNLDESVPVKRRKVCLIEEEEGYDKCVESIETDSDLQACRKYKCEMKLSFSKMSTENTLPSIRTRKLMFFTILCSAMSFIFFECGMARPPGDCKAICNLI